MPSEVSGYLSYGFSPCSLAFKEAHIVASALLTNGVLLQVCAYSPSILKVPSPGSHHEGEEVFKFMYHSHNVTHSHVRQNLNPN